MADPVLTVGTAGHIDHGKTTLVRALTGIDTDRLPQERARGMTIELGFAPLDLPSGRRVSVVDVPGHERFVRTMVAGAAGIDVYLLVIAADDGVMPQTREHAAILDLLGVAGGVVAVSKCDAVAAARVVQVVEQARALTGSEAVAVSARTGAGLADLRDALDRAVSRAHPHHASGPLRMPIDRAFTLRGIGTVATGTLWAGAVGVGDAVAVEPGGHTARVRSVQVHDEPRERAAAGHRVAVALPGIAKADAGAGRWLIQPGSVGPSYRVSCALRELPGHALAHGQLVTVHHGTAQTPARVALAEGKPLELRLQRPLYAAAGDSVIVRLTAPAATVAGGRILDPHPRRRRMPAGPAEPARLAPPVDRPTRPADDPQRDAAVVAVLELAAREQGVTLAQARDRLGCSRREAETLLTALDTDGLTRRLGERRVLRRRGRARLDERSAAAADAPAIPLDPDQPA